MRRRLCTALFCLSVVSGQQPSGENKGQPAVTLRSTTRLVQVSVVVHDKHGDPVRDLKKEDFTITEKGKPQSISVFSMETSDRTASAVKLPPNIFSNRLTQKAGVPNTVTVILFDALNTRFQDQLYARRQVMKFLRQLRPEDHVAIYTLGRSLRILHDYTSDSSALLARLEKYSGENLPDLESSQSPSLNGAFGLGDVFQTQAESDFFTTQRVVNTLRVLEVIAGHLAGVPGRKNLIWVSGGFPLQIGFDDINAIGSTAEKRMFNEEIDATVRALNNAGVAMYPVDARGLLIGSNFKGAEFGGKVDLAPKASLKPTVENLDTMRELADRTGGRASYNSNDLEHAIERAMNDSRVTYTLGYYPAAEADGRFHDLKVKVDRPGLNIRYRKGYFAMPDASEDPKVRQAEMQNAVWSPLDSTAMSVNTRVDLIDKPEPNTLNVITQIDPSNVSFSQENGRYIAKLDVLLVQKDGQGHAYGESTKDTLDLKLLPATYAKISKEGMLLEKRIPRQAKASTLRVVVRDIPTGAIGSLSIPLRDVRPFSEVAPKPKTN